MPKGLAINHDLAWNNFYGVLDAARLGNLNYSAAAVVKEIFESNLAQSMINDLQGSFQFKGIALLSTAGRILGITQAGVNLNTLITDLTDGDGQVSMVNVLDAGISVGSLFIKSNAVGFAVSAGWLLVKGEFE